MFNNYFWQWLLLSSNLKIFFIGKIKVYILKKKHKKMGPKRASLSIREVYISHLKAKLKAKRGYKKQHHPHLEPNQSKKLIKDNGLSSINNLVQDHKLQTKEFFDL